MRIKGDRLKKARKKKSNKEKRKIDLKTASNEMNISLSYLSELEKGKAQNPSSKTLEKLSNYYDISTDYILGRNNIMNNNIEIPDSIANLLNNKEQDFVKEVLEKENTSMLLRETRGMSEQDVATAISLIKAYKDSKKWLSLY